MFYTFLYCLTVYIPLRFRDFCINSLALFVKRQSIIETAYKLLKEKSLIGVLPDGNLIFYPLDDFKLLPIISEIYCKKIYDTPETQTFRCICDVGAHIGLFALRVARQAPKSRVIAIEANPTNFKFLLKNVHINGLETRVRVLSAAAGQGKGRVTLWLSNLSRGDSSTKKWHDAGSAGHVEVDMLPLDYILSNERSCDLVKVDVEGAEMDVLKGFEKKCTKVNRLEIETHISIVNVDEIYEWLLNHCFVIMKKRKLYEDCVLLKARRQCA